MWSLIYLQVLAPILSILLMALSYNLPSDSTDVIPLELNMYRYSTALYSSDDSTIGQRYEDTVRHYGETAKRVASDVGVSNGTYHAFVVVSRRICK